MADDLTVPATGAVLATDDDGTRHWPWEKLAWGPDGTFNKVDTATGKPLPTQVRSATGLIPIGEPTDAKSTATDATSVTLISISKQISASAQLTVTGLTAVEAAIVSATGVVGAGTAAAAQRSTLASDDPAVVTLGATTGAKVITDANGTIQQYLRGLIFQWITGGSLSAAMAFQTSGIVTLQSNATGTTYNVFGSQACKELTLINDTGTDLEIRQDGAGSTFILWSGSAYSYRGITNANQVGYRRKDVSNTQVTLAANWVA